MRNSSRAGLGATSFAAAAAVVLLAAPNANALVTDISVSGSTYCTGQTYSVTVNVTATSGLFNVTLSDNNTEVGKAKPSNGSAVFQWTPTTTGSHTLEAVQELVSKKSTTVEVSDCTPAGGTGSSSSNPLAGLLSTLSAK